jgi:hypothetical protein
MTASETASDGPVRTSHESHSVDGRHLIAPNRLSTARRRANGAVGHGDRVRGCSRTEPATTQADAAHSGEMSTLDRISADPPSEVIVVVELGE